MNNIKARVIAFYLPQFHTIPENDKWWGKGFTEWTNVKKAKPLFKGHYQPRIPSDLGYYNLLNRETREAQAFLARKAGIEGFCYWHYWFGGGQELLEKPFNDVVDCNKPDFPFCLGWANHSWTNKTWKIGDNKTEYGLLMEQNYLGQEDIDLHFNRYLKAFKDSRYIKVDGKCLFVIFSPFDLPNSKFFIDRWNQLALQNGLIGFHFVGITQSFEINSKSEKFYKLSKLNNSKVFYDKVINLGFDAVNSRTSNFAQIKSKSFLLNYFDKFLAEKLSIGYINKYYYSDIIKHLIVEEDKMENVYPTIIPNWDRSPRSGSKASIWHESTPDLFEKHLKKAIEYVSKKHDEHKIIFLQSWNEWGEGNYIEPDEVFSTQYLEKLSDNLFVN